MCTILQRFLTVVSPRTRFLYSYLQTRLYASIKETNGATFAFSLENLGVECRLKIWQPKKYEYARNI